MRVAIAGGTGFLGRAITRALLDSGHAVRVISRSQPSRNPLDSRTEWRKGDVTEPDTLASALEGCDAVVDAVQFPNSPMEDPGKGFTFERIDLQGTKNLVDAARTAGVPLFIGLSGAGAAAGAQYHWLRFKWDEEEYIRQSGLQFVIFRPSWVYGPGDVALNRMLGFGRFLPFIPIVGSGRTRISPLFVDDLAAHVVAALANERALGRTFDIGGPEVLTMNEIVRTALRASGKRRFLFPQPKIVMKAIASVVQFAPGRPLTPDGVDFVTMDGVTDNGPLRETFGLRLTPLEEGLRSYL